MTKAQRSKYWREWSRVKRVVGSEADDQLRHELHIKALGSDKSSSAFTNRDFDTVLAVFWAISKPADMDAQLAQMNQDRKRLVWKICNEQLRLLKCFMEDPEAYLAKLLQDRFGVDSVEELSHQEGRLYWEDKKGKGSHLHQLFMTLAARIDRLRREKGWTVEDLEFYGLGKPRKQRGGFPVPAHITASDEASSTLKPS